MAPEPHRGARRMETLPAQLNLAAGTSHSFLNKGTVLRQERPLMRIIKQELSEVQDREVSSSRRGVRDLGLGHRENKLTKKLTRLFFFFSTKTQNTNKHWFLPEKAWHLRAWE